MRKTRPPQYKIAAIVVLILGLIGIWLSIDRKDNMIMFIGSSEDQVLYDGPDKALIHEWLKTRNVVTGEVEKDKLVAAMSHVRENVSRSATRDFGWQSVPTRVPGRGRALYLHENTNELFTGSVSGGLWKLEYNEAGDNTWVNIEGFEGYAVNCLSSDPNEAGRMYLGTGESYTAFVNYRESSGLGSGIYVSDDNGNSWSALSSTSNFYYVNDIVVRDEEGMSVIYAAIGSGEYETQLFAGEGVYKSTDGGATWDRLDLKVRGGDDYYQVSDIELTSDSRLLMGTMRNSSDRGGSTLILESEDGSWEVWTDVHNRIRDSEDFDYYPGRTIVKSAPSNPEHLYFLTTYGNVNDLDQLRDYDVELWQSRDGGETWADVSLPSYSWANIPWHALALAVDPNNEDKIVLGALGIYALEDVGMADSEFDGWHEVSTGGSRLSTYDFIEDPEERQYRIDRIVHSDIHDMQFINGSSDRMLITTDGGVFQTSNMSKRGTGSFMGDGPTFSSVGHQLNTTQYYYGALSPELDELKFMGGTQDNGTLLFVQDEEQGFVDSRLSGGDGAYCFWDRDNPELIISSLYNNGNVLHVGGQKYYPNRSSGLFINPCVYDDESNLHYSNVASSSFGGFRTGLSEGNSDSIQVINVNFYLGRNRKVVSLPPVEYLYLGTDVNGATSAMKLFMEGAALDRSAVIGTVMGEVYKLTGLPYNIRATRIDNGLFEGGYISSVDFGATEETMMVTISNYGRSSVFVTYDGGASWIDLDNRNLPDIPVRWGLFNPYDNDKVVIATELGVWGLESIVQTSEDWQLYNEGFPIVRVDVIDIREADSTILAATHGQGFYYGKLNQGEAVSVSTEEEVNIAQLSVYPNPSTGIVNFEIPDDLVRAEVFDKIGRKLRSVDLAQKSMDLSDLAAGFYFIKFLDQQGKDNGTRRVVISK